MVKKTYKQKLLDPRWQKLRLEVMQRDNFTCQYCASKNKTLHIHHLKYSKTGNPWDVDISKLICLCEDCHHVLHILEKENILFSKIMNDILFYSVIDNDNYAIKLLVKTANRRIIEVYPKIKY
jgi:hypothetical protein